MLLMKDIWKFTWRSNFVEILQSSVLKIIMNCIDTLFRRFFPFKKKKTCIKNKNFAFILRLMVDVLYASMSARYSQKVFGHNKKDNQAKCFH